MSRSWMAAGWLAVLAAGAGAQAASPPRLVLSHLVITLDSATYHDVAHSPFMLGQFAGYQDSASGQVVPCAGVCFFGRHTWLEIRGPGHPAGARPGQAGLTLSSERAGGLTDVVKLARTGATSVDTTTWEGRDSSGPFPAIVRWSDRGVDSLGGAFSLGVNEFSLQMAQRARIRDSQPDDDRSRDRLLAPLLVKDQLLAEITSATMSIPVQSIAAASRTLTRLGVRVVPEGEGAVILLPGFTLRLEPAWDKPAVSKLEFALQREALANPTYRFGASSRLLFGPGRVAVWEF